MNNGTFEEVTLWYKKIQIEVGPGDIKEEWVFNHLEDGNVFLYQQKPKPIKSEFKEQAKEWPKCIWAKQSALLVNGVVNKLGSLKHITNEGKLEFISDITGKKISLDYLLKL